MLRNNGVFADAVSIGRFQDRRDHLGRRAISARADCAKTFNVVDTRAG
jgi:hypothetical protein